MNSLDKVNYFIKDVWNKYFIKHLNDNNITYEKHFVRSILLSSRTMICSIVFIIHAFFPFIFEKKGSEMIEKLYNDLNHSNHSNHSTQNKNGDKDINKEDK